MINASFGIMPTLCFTLWKLLGIHIETSWVSAATAEVEPYPLVCLRNPHGVASSESKLPWRDNSEEWAANPAVAAKLGADFEGRRRLEGFQAVTRAETADENT